jgi:uroporphyrinogen-III synthase
MAIPPLAGFTVAVTADRRREEQVELLRRRGADVIEGPTVRTEPLGDDAALGEAIDAMIGAPPDITVMLTGLGVRSLLGAAESRGVGDQLMDAIAASAVYTRGPKATGAAVTAGIEVAFRTAGERSVELCETLASAASAGRRIAIVRDGDAEPHLARSLGALGASTVDMPVYRWTMPVDLQPAQRLLDAVCSRSVDAVTFTSSPAVRNLFSIASDAGLQHELLAALNGPVAPVAVGPVCAETAKALGVELAITPKRARLGTMVLSLAAELGTRVRRLRLGGVDIMLQGSLAVIGDAEARLADRERALLHVLADAGGAVVTKRALVRSVWGDTSADEHTVEVTVSRLRRRLGVAGEAIMTVPRRGYRLA